MNERIKELAEQARVQAEDSYKKQNEQFTSHWDNPIGYTVSQFFEQKFAELIVQDINNTILHTARWHQEVEKDDNTVMALCDLVKYIREEYGVK